MSVVKEALSKAIKKFSPRIINQQESIMLAEKIGFKSIAQDEAQKLTESRPSMPLIRRAWFPLFITLQNVNLSVVPVNLCYHHMLQDAFVNSPRELFLQVLDLTNDSDIFLQMMEYYLRIGKISRLKLYIPQLLQVSNEKIMNLFNAFSLNQITYLSLANNDLGKTDYIFLVSMFLPIMNGRVYHLDIQNNKFNMLDEMTREIFLYLLSCGSIIKLDYSPNEFDLMSQVRIRMICQQNLQKTQTQYPAYIDTNVFLSRLETIISIYTGEAKSSPEASSQYYLPLSQNEAPVMVRQPHDCQEEFIQTNNNGKMEFLPNTSQGPRNH